MLDDLLGRTELKARIEELQEERDRLQARLDAESGRRADAVSARQEAEERVNRLEDRIADLEGRLETDQESAAIGFRREETLRGGRLESVLSRLSSFEGDPESVLTAYVEGGAPEGLADLLGDRAPLVDRAAPCLVWADDAGLLAAAVRPPVAPEPFLEWDDAPRFEREWLRPTGRFALALVRSDTFALGVYEGDERVDFEGFTSDVKSDHSKGGFSQSRFERLRDEQIAAHVEDCEEALASVDVRKPTESSCAAHRNAERSADADRLYVVGDRRLVAAFDPDGEATVAADATAAVDATGDPEPALEDAFENFWTVRLYAL
jgi:peptide subunit release factor 1 (eRF1)